MVGNVCKWGPSLFLCIALNGLKYSKSLNISISTINDSNMVKTFWSEEIRD